jgi:hypothetical protein
MLQFFVSKAAKHVAPSYNFAKKHPQPLPPLSKEAEQRPAGACVCFFTGCAFFFLL